MPASALASPRILPCPRCGVGLAAEAVNSSGESVCPLCGAHFAASLFPAFWRDGEADRAHSIPALEGDASCFFHPENRAAHACDRCGRFVCSICEITVGSNRLCPNCLSVGLVDPKKAEFIPWRFLWADGAVLIGVLPMILGLMLWPMLPLTALTAVVFAVMAWLRPGSIPRGQRRGAAVVGALCGLLQIVLFAGIVLALSGRFHR